MLAGHRVRIARAMAPRRTRGCRRRRARSTRPRRGVTRVECYGVLAQDEPQHIEQLIARRSGFVPARAAAVAREPSSWADGPGSLRDSGGSRSRTRAEESVGGGETIVGRRGVTHEGQDDPEISGLEVTSSRPSMGHVSGLAEVSARRRPEEELQAEVCRLADQEEDPRRPQEGRREGRSAVRRHRPRPVRVRRSAWHPRGRALASPKKNVYRITFNEITERAGQGRLHAAGQDRSKKGRRPSRRARVLDRLVGYSLSPLLLGKRSSAVPLGRNVCSR